jgi:hypothetical protein
MSLITQCSAPVRSTRCPNPAIDEDKMQCIDHYPKAIKLYIEYKKLCDIADTFDIEEVEEMKTTREKVSFLHECYVSYMKAYNARMKHRNYAIVPECEDYGHDLQFLFLKDKMLRCEEKLEKIYYQITLDREINLEEVSREENSSETKEEEESSTFIETVNTFKERRLQDEKETNRAIEDYIKDNKQILRTKQKYINIIHDKLLSFIPRKSKYIYWTMMLMVTILKQVLVKHNNLRKKKLYPYNNMKNIQTYQKGDVFEMLSDKINIYTSLKDALRDVYLPEIITMKDFLESLDEWSSDILIKIGKVQESPPPVGYNTMLAYLIKGYRFEFLIEEKPILGVK